ncbi:MAG: ADP-ribosylglycohydrolase family protein, partial [Cryomorphaceae bacterium]|nr:ADP-ribosylglycohydrolase family protein [Cryomorphaceae bacterium]
TRQNFPNKGIDSFTHMAAEGIKVVDRVVEEELKGEINLIKNTWLIPVK